MKKLDYEMETRKQLYNAFMSNLKDCCVDEDGKVITKIGNAPMSLLYIDEAYQGDRKHSRTKKLATEWSWVKYDMITVVPHPETYQLSVIDGQNRSNAGKLKGFDTMPVKVVCGAPNDIEKRLEFEAKVFVKQDEQIDKLKPVEKHNANLILKDKATVILDKELKKFGLSYKKGCGKRSARVIGVYTDHLNMAKTYGEDILEFIYTIIENAGWGEETNGYAAPQVRGLKGIYANHDMKEEREKISKFLSVALRKMTSVQFVSNAMVKYPTRDKRIACSLFLDDMLVEANVVERTMYPQENGSIKVVKTSDRKTA